MRQSVQTFGLSVIIVLVVITVFLGFLWGVDNPVPWIGIAVLVALPYIHKRWNARHFVAWKDELSVGVDAIDADHKKLLDLINDLQQAVHYHMGESFERKALGDLVEYTKKHFEREEGMMQSAGFPGFEEHKKEHEAMAARVKELCKEYNENRDATINRMAEYLKNWLISHIQGSDQRYAPYLKERVGH